MGDKFDPCCHSSENKYTNSKKRMRQPDKQFNNPKPKKFKHNRIQNGYKSDVDIITSFKLELEQILMEAKDINTNIEDIQPYGSRISGLYTYESDVDLNISYTSTTPINKLIRLFASSLNKSKIFIKVFPLTHAKIPIIKCVHRKTWINCDISFNNISAVHNSRLLNQIISMDYRIKPVLMKLKIWAKNIGLISTNGFSSYSFYWLGLFYMQVIGILPSIHDLQKSESELIVENWNYCSFSIKEQECLKDNHKNLSESNIINAIFSYYSNFDFGTFVICPYIGSPLLKHDFKNIDQLPKEYWRYKQFYISNKKNEKLLFLGDTKYNMYIQDPFQHNKNITARVIPKIFEKFKKACKNSDSADSNVWT